MLCDIYEKQDKIDEALLLLRNSIAEQTQNAKNDALYKKVIQLYTSQNKMSEAFQFLNESDSYIKTRLFKYRPENLTPNPAQGVYDSQISVTFDIQEGCSVYYTLDGSQPTKDSSLYSQDSKIIIDKGLVTLRAFAINENGLISDEVNAQYRVYNDNTPYEFIDSKVEAIVRATLKLSLIHI